MTDNEDNLWRNGLDLVPEHMRPSVRNYLEHGLYPGSFVEALFANDLAVAIQLADEINFKSLRNLMKFVTLYAPSTSQHSYHNVKTWQESQQRISKELRKGIP